jgi:glycerol uptake facilitator-like aquaporin
MSLKWFHLFFIGTCVLLAIVVAVWALQNAQWLLAFAALAAGAGLIVYRGFFLRKARDLGLR